MIERFEEKYCINIIYSSISFLNFIMLILLYNS